MVAGVDMWHTAAVERLGIPALKVTDGPIGARGERWTGGRSAAFPCGTALGATWDPALVRRGRAPDRRRGAPQARARAARAHGQHPSPSARRPQLRVLLRGSAPLRADAAVAYITGVQSNGIGCSVKHFVANDSEFERMTISSEVDERTLREISLVPFEAAVLEAGAWSVMSAYNRLNGAYCSEQPWLLGELLKGEWAFDGMVVSDWYGTHSTTEAANAGLDLEMPGPPQWFGTKLADAVRAGDVDEKRLDDMVRRVLTILDRSGALDVADPLASRPRSRSTIPIDRDVARRAASGSFVLLQNTSAALPLDRCPHARGRRAERRHRARDGRRQRARADASAPYRRSSGSAPASATTSRSATSGAARTTRSRRPSTPASSTARSRSRTTPGASAPAIRCSSRTPSAGTSHGWAPSAGASPTTSPSGSARRSCRRNRVRGRSASCRPAARACCSTATCSSTTGTRPSGVRRSTAWAAPSSRQTVDLVAGRALRARRRGDPGRARARWSVRRAGAARRGRPHRTGGRCSRARPTLSSASSAPTGEWETEGNDRESMTLPGAAGRARARGRGGEPAHDRRRERGVAGRDAVGGRRRRGAAVLVRG